MVRCGVVWCGRVWYCIICCCVMQNGILCMVWYGTVQYGMVWYGILCMVWYGKVWYGMLWYGMLWYGMAWYDLLRCGMVCYGMVWYGMISYGTVSSGFVSYLIVQNGTKYMVYIQYIYISRVILAYNPQKTVNWQTKARSINCLWSESIYYYYYCYCYYYCILAWIFDVGMAVVMPCYYQHLPGVSVMRLEPPLKSLPTHDETFFQFVLIQSLRGLVASGWIVVDFPEPLVSMSSSI